MTPWLFLVHRIPPRPLYLRAKMRTRLGAAGAIALKNSVYVLPDRADAREDLEWIAQEIVTGGGDAHLIAGEFVDPAATTAAIGQFRESAAAAYGELAAEARKAEKTTLAVERLSRRLEQIQRIDFFHAKSRRDAEQALGSLSSQLARGQKVQAAMRTTHPELKGRTWVTRPGVKVDRISSAWFIRRFIDPRARFRFEDPQVPKRARDLRFDMLGGDFTHEGDRCTLETLIKRVGLPDTGVQSIAEIVHDIDLKDGKFGRPETPGVSVALDGLVRQHADDSARIAQGLLLFDHLHEGLSRTKRS
jgi:hypothetical protein